MSTSTTTDEHPDILLAKRYITKADLAKAGGVEFSLSLTSFKNLMKAKKCYYTGVELTDKRSGKAMRGTDRTIDRFGS